MTSETISFAIDGEVPIAAAGETLKALNRLLHCLTDEHAPGAKIRWVLTEFSGGRMKANVKAVPDHQTPMEQVQKVTASYYQMGCQLARGEAFAGLPKTQQALQGLMQEAEQVAATAWFGANSEQAAVPLAAANGLTPRPGRISLGAVTGILDTITSNRQPHVVIADEISGDRVRCYLADEDLNIAAGAFGKRAHCRGELKRAADSRRKLEIRNVIVFELREPRPRYRMEDAFGKGSWRPGDPPSDIYLREMRDADG